MTDPPDAARDIPPPNPRAGRQHRLAVTLDGLVWVTAAAAGVTLALSGLSGDGTTRAVEMAGWILAGLLITAPVARVLWLIVRWLRLGDLRFALVGAVLLLVVGAGTLIVT